MLNLKPHISYEGQLQLLSARGMIIDDPTTALSALKTIGYYRLSGYSYPLRKISSDPGKSPVTRLDDYIDETKFEDIIKLYNFDHKLRFLLLSGLETIEKALAVKIGYILGKHDAEAHLDTRFLDNRRCSEPSNTTGLTRHEDWVSRFKKLKSAAKNEQFVKHHILSYNDRIPLWAATEFLDFGNLVRLFSFMRVKDRTKIAKEFGLEDNAGSLLESCLRTLNTLRNHCAHGARIWNRAIVKAPKVARADQTPPKFHHVLEIDKLNSGKLYYLVSMMALLIPAIDGSSNWPLQARTQFKKFVSVNGLTLTNSMNFPKRWENEPLWTQRVRS